MTTVSSNQRSTFTWERVEGVMVITDLDDGTLQLVSCSVTNDAENVIKYLVKFAGLRSSDGFDDHERVVYRDTQGRWDELLHQNGKFAGFDHIGARSRDVALLAIKRTPNALPGKKEDDDPWA